MRQTILQSFKHCAIIGIAAMAALLSACSSKEKSYAFDNPKEAVNACRKELSELKGIEKADINRLMEVTARWLELQDSTVSCFLRDTTEASSIGNDVAFHEVFFAVSDSIRTEIMRLALSEKRSLADIVKLKVATSYDRKKIIASENFKHANEFYKKMDEEPLYNDVGATLEEYEKLLTNADPFKTEQDLYQFIRKEDKCFRSLLAYLKEIPQEKLQEITDKTSSLFDALYRNTVADLENKINARVMMYLTMRFNRRIIQNAETCRNDIKTNKTLTPQQAANYRWMLIQPLMTIDNYAMATMNDEQIQKLTTIAKELPELLAYLDDKDFAKSPKEETEKLKAALSEYFLKSYMKAIL